MTAVSNSISQGSRRNVVFQVLAADRTLEFDTTSIDDQFYNIDTAVNLTLPQATGGTGTLAYTLMPRDSIPFGLLFNSDSAERTLTGTPTATVTTAVILTYTVTDSATPTPATIALDFMMTVTKRLQTDFSFASTKVIKTIDDSSFTETATGGSGFSHGHIRIQRHRGRHCERRQRGSDHPDDREYHHHRYPSGQRRLQRSHRHLHPNRHPHRPDV